MFTQDNTQGFSDKELAELNREFAIQKTRLGNYETEDPDLQKPIEKHASDIANNSFVRDRRANVRHELRKMLSGQ
jgi:hypothetical protein